MNKISILPLCLLLLLTEGRASFRRYQNHARRIQNYGNSNYIGRRIDTDDRIIGGAPVDICEAPYQVSLHFRHPPRFFCGGSIISCCWVLTAAHCVESFSRQSTPTNVFVRIGSSFQTSDGEVRSIEQIIRHPYYDSSTHHNDFALLKVDKPFIFSKKIKKIAVLDTLLPAMTKITITGWGTTKHHGRPSEVLMGTQVYLTDFDACNKSYNNKLTHRYS